MAINSGWTVVYSADNVSFFEDTGEMTYSPDGLCSSSSDDENKYCKAVLGDKLDYRIGLLDWTSEMSAVTPSTPISAITCNIEKEDSVDSCNEDMLTCWFKDTTNPYSISALTSGDNFDKKIVDECSQILEIKFKPDGNSSYHFKTGEQKFETSSYTDSGYPIISTDPNTSASTKYVEGVEYNNYHKVKYRVRSGFTPTNCIVNNSQLVELYFPHLHGSSNEGRNVSVITEGSFSGNTSLSAVTFGGKALEKIGDYAFANCTALTFIDWYHQTCHSSRTNRTVLNTIGIGAFSGCTSLTNVILPDVTNTYASISGNAFSNCTSLTAVTIGSGFANIDSTAFNGCNSLSEVTFRGGPIKDNWFKGNTHIKKIIVDASTISVNEKAFSGCTSLSAITKGSNGSYSNIGASAFTNCTNLETVNLGSSLHSIGDYAFSGCNRITDVYVSVYSSSAPTISVNNAFSSSIKDDATLHVASGMKRLFEISNWHLYFNNIVEP